MKTKHTRPNKKKLKELESQEVPSMKEFNEEQSFIRKKISAINSFFKRKKVHQEGAVKSSHKYAAISQVEETESKVKGKK